MLDVLCSERFGDWSPSEVFHRLLDEDTYLCWERTMYRILAEADGVKERRNQLRHPKHARLELMATGPVPGTGSARCSRTAPGPATGETCSG